jgi:hypothetical protein
MLGVTVKIRGGLVRRRSSSSGRRRASAGGLRRDGIRFESHYQRRSIPSSSLRDDCDSFPKGRRKKTIDRIFEETDDRGHGLEPGLMVFEPGVEIKFPQNIQNRSQQEFYTLWERRGVRRL